MNSRDQGNLMTLTKGHVVFQNFQSTSSLKLFGQFQLNSIYSLQANGERKFYTYGPGHVTKMAVMPIYGKNLKTIASPEQLET